MYYIDDTSIYFSTVTHKRNFPLKIETIRCVKVFLHTHAFSDSYFKGGCNFEDNPSWICIKC